MRPLITAVLAASLLIGCRDARPPTSPLTPTQSARSSSVADATYIVVLNSGDPRAFAAAQGLTPSNVFMPVLRGFSAQLSAQAVDALERNPNVEYVELSGHRRISDTETPAVWNLDRIDTHPLVFDQSYTYPSSAGAGVHAYIIDSGIRQTHVEFYDPAGSRFGLSVTFAGDSLGDCIWHGSHVAGTVGGHTYGVAKHVIYHIDKIFDCDGTADDTTVLKGINWVAVHRELPAVANMSFGGDFSQAINDAVDGLIASGVTVGIAAGNGNTDACTQSPSSNGNALVVAASDSLDSKAYFSNWGPCVTMWAPGINITSAGAWNDIGRYTISGTSMATPHVVGAAALYLADHPSASPADVKAYLIAVSTPDKIARATELGSPNRLVFVEGGTTSEPPPPPPPATVVASFTWNCVRLACSFDASASHADAGIASYAWSFGDGANGSGVTASHTYSKPGAKTVSLIVTATDGASAIASQNVKPSKR